MYNYRDIEQYGRDHQSEILAEAEHLRLMHRAALFPHPRIRAFALFLRRVGSLLLNWGTRLQEQEEGHISSTPTNTNDNRQFTA